MQSGNKNDLTSRSSSNVKTGSRNQQPVTNGVARSAVPPQRTSPEVTLAHGAVNNGPNLKITPAENGDAIVKLAFLRCRSKTLYIDAIPRIQSDAGFLHSLILPIKI
ncbi:UNVERIFIED_CONTAM: hypothetical protein Sradi_5443000 [Sesamum radiatum]|uniref:Uncharacterized protein n=1 Tax=Sesamum radiatum TaxID=300843 RepID=A0AAW2L9U5_SESRA